MYLATLSGFKFNVTQVSSSMLHRFQVQCYTGFKFNVALCGGGGWLVGVVVVVWGGGRGGGVFIATVINNELT